MVLKVSVGEFSSSGRISPYGTSPNLISAWKPLQIPSISPSRLCSKLLTASAIRGFRNMVAMNLPLPSGSSPALKPPGSMMIWDSLIPFTMAWIVSSIAWAVRLRMIKILLSAPARSKARAVSYSQFCPGNTGINTFGLAMFTGAVKGNSLLYSGCSSKSFGVSVSGDFAGKMGSSVSV